MLHPIKFGTKYMSMRSLFILISFQCLFSSCFTYRSISGKIEPTAEDIRMKIQPKKMHWVALKSGKEFKLYVTRIDSIKVYGEIQAKDAMGFSANYAFEDTFENLQTNSEKISVRKFNPYITGGIILVPVIFGIIYAQAAYVSDF